MTEQELIDLVVKETDGEVSYPFNRPGQHAAVIFSVVKHRAKNKVIALIYTQDKQVRIDVKLTPAQNESLRMLAGVETGRHLDKKYWTTINVNQTVLTKKELRNIIRESARLTA